MSAEAKKEAEAHKAPQFPTPNKQTTPCIVKTNEKAPQRKNQFVPSTTITDYILFGTNFFVNQGTDNDIIEDVTEIDKYLDDVLDFN